MESVAPGIGLSTHRSDSSIPVWISATSDEESNEREISPLGRKAQRRVGHGVRLVNVRICTRVEQLLRNVVITAPAGVAQGRPLPGVLSIHRRTVQEQLKHLGTVLRTDSKHQRGAIIDRVWLDGGHEA